MKKGKKGLVISVILAVLLLGFLIWFFLLRSKDTKKATAGGHTTAPATPQIGAGNYTADPDKNKPSAFNDEVLVAKVLYISPRVADGSIIDQWKMEIRFESDYTPVVPGDIIRLYIPAESAGKAYAGRYKVREIWDGGSTGYARTAIVYLGSQTGAGDAAKPMIQGSINVNADGAMVFKKVF